MSPSLQLSSLSRCTQLGTELAQMTSKFVISLSQGQMMTCWNLYSSKGPLFEFHSKMAIQTQVSCSPAKVSPAYG